MRWLNLVRLVFCLFATSIAMPAVAAGEKPVLDVCFSLSELMYTVEFDDDDKRRIELKAASIVTAKLVKRTAFIDARALPVEEGKECKERTPDGWLLKVDLNRRDPDASGDLHDIGFHLQLRSPQGDDSDNFFWALFRKAGSELDVSFQVPGFIDQISRSLDGDGANFDRLVEQLLVRLPVPSTASFDNSGLFGPSWRLESHTYEQLCMRENSELVFESEFKGYASAREVYTVVRKPRGDEWHLKNITSEPSARNDDRMLKVLKDISKDDVQVVAVYVGKYVQLGSCVVLTPQESGL